MYRTIFKRIFDIVFAATALIVLSPFLLLAALCVFTCEDRGPIFFRQRRIGRGGEQFGFEIPSMPVNTDGKLQAPMPINSP